MEEVKTSLVTAIPPFALTPDTEPGWYVYHDRSGDTGLIELVRPRDPLLARFPGCEEEFYAESLDGLFEGPLTKHEMAAAVDAVERLQNR